MPKIRHLILTGLFVLSPLKFVWGHSESEAPVDFVAGVPGSVERNRAGYGWLNASSEAEADSVFRQECPRGVGSGNMSVCLPQNSPFQTAYHLASNSLEGAVTLMAQENAYEYLIMQRAAISPGNPSWDVPDCLTRNPKVQKVKEEVDLIKSKNEIELNEHIRTLATQKKAIEDRPVASRTPEETAQLAELERRHSIAVKMRAVRESVNPDRMAQAFLLDKQLAQAQSRNCGPLGVQRKCMSIKRNRDRIRMAFPSVFPGGITELDAFGDPNDARLWEERTTTATGMSLTRCGTTPYQRFEKSIYMMLGYKGAPNPIPGSGTGPGTPGSGPGATGFGCQMSDQNLAAISRGQTSVAAAFTTDQGYRDVVSNTKKGTFTLARQAAFDARRGVGTPSTAPVDERMAQAYDVFTDAAVHMRAVQEKSAETQKSLICTRNNLNSIAQFQPQAIRQVVMDQSDPRAKEGMLRVMCRQGVMERLQANDQTLDCTGVSGDPSVGDGMAVERTSYNFPFQSDSKYTLKRLPDGSMEVATKINYRFTYDPSIDPDAGSGVYAGDANVPAAMRKNQATQQAEFDTNTLAWVSQATSWYNTQAASIGQPRVRFRIEKCTTCADGDKPRVSVSQCYRRVAPDSFATNFGAGTAWNPRRCWFQGGVNKAPNWQDAGNFTTSMAPSTIMHETGHNMSLADEYTADYYPANAVGEYGALSCNSTMGSTDSSCHRIYPRHLLEITRPARACPRP